MNKKLKKDLWTSIKSNPIQFAENPDKDETKIKGLYGTGNGWIKFFRKSLFHPLFRKPQSWHFFQWCLLRACHTPQKIIWNRKELIVERGSFIMGRKKAAKETGLSEQTIRTALQTLVELDMVQKSTTKSTNKFSYISVINFDSYQNNEMSINQETNHQSTSKQPHTRSKRSNKPKPSPPKKQADGRIKEFLDFYHQKYLQKFGVKPSIEGGRDGTILKGLLSDHDLEHLQKHIPTYFKSGDSFFQKNGYDLPRFKTFLNGVKVGAYQKKSNRPTEVAI